MLLLWKFSSLKSCFRKENNEKRFSKKGDKMGRRGLWQGIMEDVNIDNREIKRKYGEIARRAKNPNQVRFAVTHDFKNSRKNRSRISKFHRNLKN